MKTEIDHMEKLRAKLREVLDLITSSKHEEINKLLMAQAGARDFPTHTAMLIYNCNKLIAREE